MTTARDPQKKKRAPSKGRVLLWAGVFLLNFVLLTAAVSLAVFHPRCRADELDVPARQQGLEDAAGVDAALRRARAHDGVHLVDE